MPAGGGEPRQVTRKGGHIAFESPDGRWLYYTKNPTTTITLDSPLWRMSVDGGGETEVLPSVHYRAFQVIDGGILFVRQQREDRLPVLMYYSETQSKSRALLEIAQPVLFGIAATRDGRNVLWTQEDLTGSDLVMIDRFR